MRISKDALTPIVRRMAGDPELGDRPKRFATELVSDAIDAALRATHRYSGAVEFVSWKAEEDSTTQFTLPDGTLRVLRFGVIDDIDGVTWYARARPASAGSYMTGLEESYDVVGDLLLISPELDEGDQVKVFLEKAWMWPNEEQDELDLPVWVVDALPFYACYYLMTEKAAKFAVEGQWKTKQDSGRPIDNPAIEGANWFLGQFQQRCMENIRQEVE